MVGATAEHGIGPTSVTSALPLYQEFTGATRAVQNATRQDLIAGIVAIVQAEGPVVGQRLHTAYVRASGGQRVGKAVAAELNSAVTAAVRRGLLMQDSPLDEQGVKPRTYRTPDQPSAILRELGPRSFDEIPPRELATLLALVAEGYGWANQDQLFRAALDRLGLQRLTTNVRQRLQSVLGLAAS